MTRLPDEQWAMIEDSIDKKRTAASAFKQRTHCGKGGSVKFPSDFMSKKELRAMNSEVKSYRMNAPLSWEEFKELPSDLKVSYIQSLRDKFNVPDGAIAEMFDVSLAKLTLYLKDLKLEMVHDIDIWNKEAFLAWRSGGNPSLVKETEPVEEVEGTKYERKAMIWKEFEGLTADQKRDYIAYLRETFKAPNTAIAESLNVCVATFRRVVSELGVGLDRSSSLGKGHWPKEEFFAWVRGERVVEDNQSTEEAPVEATVEEILEMITEAPESLEKAVEPAKPETNPVAEIVPESHPEPVKPVRATPALAIPTYGELNFDCPADQALNTLTMLLGNKRVQLHVRWDVVEE